MNLFWDGLGKHLLEEKKWDNRDFRFPLQSRRELHFSGILPTLRVNLSVPSSLEDETNNLARNVGKELLLFAT